MTDLRKFKIWFHPIAFHMVADSVYDKIRVLAVAKRVFPELTDEEFEKEWKETEALC